MLTFKASTKCATLAALTICALTSAFAQPAASPAKTFEVASIKVRQGAPQWKFSISGPRISIASYTLYGLIKEAWNLENYQVHTQGAPALLFSDDSLYDIEATAKDGTNPTRDQFRQMLQQLLADRFHLKVHQATETMPVFALQIGKSGPKLHPSAPEADPQVTFSLAGETKEYALVTSHKMSMEDFAKLLGLVNGRPVVDKTGLKGTWDIRLFHTPEYKMSRGPEPAIGEISMFTALQEQLGLKLESDKGMVNVLSVDSVEKPTEN